MKLIIKPQLEREAIFIVLYKQHNRVVFFEICVELQYSSTISIIVLKVEDECKRKEDKSSLNARYCAEG